VVFGMPKEAIKLGCVDKVVDIRSVARTALEMSESFYN
jgi:chemotaxis response regulator CheB